MSPAETHTARLEVHPITIGSVHPHGYGPAPRQPIPFPILFGQLTAVTSGEDHFRSPIMWTQVHKAPMSFQGQEQQRY